MAENNKKSLRRWQQRNTQRREADNASRRRLAAQRLGVDVAPEPEPAPRLRRDGRSAFNRGVEAGTEQVAGALPAIGSAVTGALGFEDTSRALAERAQGAQERAGEALGDLPRFSEISSLEQAGQWAAGTLGSQGPVMAFQIGSALAGGALGRQVAKRLNKPLAGSREALSGAVALRNRAREATGTATGAVSAGAGAGTTLMAGDIVPRLQQDATAQENYSQQELSQLALGGSVAGGALQAIPVTAALNRLGVGQAAERLVQRNLGSRIARGVAGQTAAEVPVDVAQAAIARGTQSLVNENIGIFDDEGLAEMLEAGAASALTSGVTGALTAAPGPVLASQEDAQFERGLERTRNQMDREELSTATAQRQHRRMRELLVPEQAEELDTMVQELGYEDPQVQRRFGLAELNFAREMDPRSRIPFGEDIRMATNRVDTEIARQLALFEERTDIDAEARTTRDALLGLSAELEEARSAQDTERFLTAFADSVLDDNLQLTPELVTDMRALLGPYEAQFTDLLRVRQDERGESPDWIEAMAEAIELDTLQQEIEAGEHSFDILTEDELSVNNELAEGFQLSGLDDRPTYIGQKRAPGAPFQSADAGRLVHGVRRESSIQKRINELRERDPDGSYREAPYRQMVEQEITDQLNEERRDRAIGDAEYRQRIERFLEHRGRVMGALAQTQQRPIGKRYNPSDPAAFLEHFSVIDRRSLPPQLGQGDGLRFSATEFNDLTTKLGHQDPNAEQTRGTINVRVYQTPDRSDSGGEHRVNVMDLATAMLDKLPGSEQGLTTERVAELVTSGLSALLDQPGRAVEIVGPRGRGVSQIPDDTVVFTQRREEGESREWTWGEVRGHVTPQLRAQVNRLAQELDQTQDKARKGEIHAEIRRLDGQIKSARKKSGRDQQQELENAWLTLSEPGYEAGDTERMEAHRTLELHQRQRDLRIEREVLAQELDMLQDAVATGTIDDPAVIDFVRSLPENVDSDFDAMMNGTVPEWADPRARRSSERADPADDLVQRVHALAERAQREPSNTGAGRPTQLMGEAPTRFFGEVVGTEYGNEARIAPGDAKFSPIKAAEQLLGRNQRLDKRLAKLKPSWHKIRNEVWAEFYGAQATPPRTLEAMQRSVANERERLLTEIRKQGLSEKAQALRQTADLGTLAQLRKQYETLLGEAPDSRWGVSEILAQVEPGAERAPVERSNAQYANEQKLVDAWVQNMGLTTRIRVVKQAEIAEVTTPEVVAGLEAGRIHAFATPTHNGEVLVHVRESVADQVARTGFYAHEVGHVVFREAVENLDTLQAQKVYKQFQKWVAKRDRPGAKLGTAVESKQSLAMMLETSKNLRAGVRIRHLPPETRDYLFDFNEWMADQTGRWLTQDARPVGVVQQFFQQVAERLRALFMVATPEHRVTVNREVRTLLGRMWDRAQADHSVNVHAQEALGRAMVEVPGQEPPLIAPPPPPADPPAANAPGPGTMLVAYTGYTGRFDEAAVAGYRRLFWSETGREERAVLARAFSGEHVRAQLRALFRDDPAATSRGVLEAVERGNVDLAFAYGMDAWMRGELTLTPRPDNIMRAIYQRIMEAFGILSDPQRAEAYLLPLKRASGAVLAETSRMPPRFLKRNQLERFAARFTETVEGGAHAIFRGFYPAQSRIYMTDNPVLIALTNQFQARTSRGGVGGTLFEARQLYTTRFQNRLRAITDGLSESEGAALLELLQNPDTALPESLPLYTVQALRGKAEQIHKALRAMRDYAVERGLDIGDRGDDYFPWVFDGDYLQEHREAFIRLVSQEKYQPYLSNATDEASRLAAAERIFDGLLQNDGLADADHEPSEGGHLPYFGSINARELAWIRDAGDERDRAQLAKFFSKDLGQTLTNYTEQLVKRAEYTARFGTPAGADRARVGNHLKLDRMLGRARDTGASAEDLHVARQFVSAMMGSYGAKELAPPLRFAVTTAGKVLGKDWSDVDPRKIRQLQGMMMVYQNFRTLALATLTSIADVGGIVARSNDPAIALKAFKAGLREVYVGVRNRTSGEAQTKTELRRMAETLGAIEATTINDALGELYGGSYLTGRARQWNDAFFNVIQLQRWTRLSRIMGLEAARSFLLQHQDGTHNRHSARFLEELGLTPGDIKRTADGADILLLSEEQRSELAARGERAELLRDDRVRVAMNRYIDQSVMRPNAAQRPIWASHPDAGLLFHLKQFTYTIHDRVVRRAFQEVGHGNFYPLAGMLSYIPVMIAADLLRELIQFGEDGDPRKEHWGLDDYAREGLHRSGITGLGTFVLDMHKDRTQFGGVGYESFQGPTLTQASQVASALAGNDAQQANLLMNAAPGNALYKNWDFAEASDDAPWTVQANAISGWRN